MTPKHKLKPASVGLRASSVGVRDFSNPGSHFQKQFDYLGFQSFEHAGFLSFSAALTGLNDWLKQQGVNAHIGPANSHASGGFNSDQFKAIQLQNQLSTYNGYTGGGDFGSSASGDSAASSGGDTTVSQSETD